MKILFHSFACLLALRFIMSLHISLVSFFEFFIFFFLLFLNLSFGVAAKYAATTKRCKKNQGQNNDKTSIYFHFEKFVFHITVQYF